MNFEGTTFRGQKFHLDLSLTITFRKFLWISRFLKLVCLYFDELLDLVNKKIKQHSFKSILGGNLFISISFKYEHLSKIFRRKVRKHLFWVWNNTIKKKPILIFYDQTWSDIFLFRFEAKLVAFEVRLRAENDLCGGPTEASSSWWSSSLLSTSTCASSSMGFWKQGFYLKLMFFISLLYQVVENNT